MAGEVPAVAAAVRIIERLAEGWPGSVPTGVLVSELQLNRSSCYNILSTLQARGWVTNRGDRSGWSLGSRLLHLTGASDTDVAEIATEEITALSRELGFVVFIAERRGPAGYGVLSTAERGSGVRVTVSRGDTFAFSAPALMQAFHAWTPPDDFDRLVERYGLTKFTRRTISDRRGLRAALERVRERGYSTSLQQYHMAQGGVAAPIFDSSGQVRWVVCSLAFATELNDSTVTAVGERVRDCAERITSRSGGVFPPGYRPKAAGVGS
jgi:IclR family acetate operon transcriptional repressor